MTEQKDIRQDDPRVGFAAMVGRVVELQDVRLRSLNAQLFNSAPMIEGKLVDLAIRRGSFYQFDEKTATLLVRVEFSLSCCASDDQPKDGSKKKRGEGQSAEALRLDVVYEAEYLLKSPPPPVEQRDQFFSAFADLNGAFNAWPYFREVVQNTVVRMGVPPIIAPLFRLPVAPPPQPAVQKTEEVCAPAAETKVTNRKRKNR